MEADSTTRDNSSKDGFSEEKLPFSSPPSNMMLFKELTNNSGEESLESQIVKRLQAFGLIPKSVKCPTGKPECKLIKKTARVIDKIQWVCEGCGKKLPIRTGSFFLRIQCSLLQALQIILAWCEDADCEAAALYFDVKSKVTSMIYDKLDELAVKEQNKVQLGGEGTVVLTEMYPDYLTRLSPDTTDQPHVHRVLMMADTKHVPTRYHLHVIRNDLKKNANTNGQAVKTEIEEVIGQKTLQHSTVVTGCNVPHIEGSSSLQQLLQHCDNDMQNFLSSRVWRGALSLCGAARELCAGGAQCAGAAGVLCCGMLQRYLLAALHRRAHDADFYRHTLTLLAQHYTDNTDCATPTTNDLSHFLVFHR